jgi:hypothetical protein
VTDVADNGGAHHPFAEEFDAKAPVHLTDKVTQVVWNNPHDMIHMTETGARAWTLEAASPDNVARKKGGHEIP